MKLFNSHLSIEKIADAIENRLAASETAAFDEHLAACAHCAAEYKTLAHSIGLMRRDRSNDAPAAAFDFARNLFRARRQFIPREQSAARKILAVLKLEVSPFSPAFGERSAAAATERQLFFEAGDFAVDLRIRSAESNFTLAGQVLGAISGENSLKLENEKEKFEAKISALGEFKIEDVPAGVFDLILKLGELEIVLPHLIVE